MMQHIRKCSISLKHLLSRVSLQAGFPSPCCNKGTAREESSLASSIIPLRIHVAHSSTNPVTPLIRCGGGILIGAKLMPFGSALSSHRCFAHPSLVQISDEGGCLVHVLFCLVIVPNGHMAQVTSRQVAKGVVQVVIYRVLCPHRVLP